MSYNTDEEDADLPWVARQTAGGVGCVSRVRSEVVAGADCGLRLARIIWVIMIVYDKATRIYEGRLSS